MQKLNIKCNNENNDSRIGDFIKSTKLNYPTGQAGSTVLTPTGDSFMYIETSYNNNGAIVFVSWERTDNIEITNITFYYNRYSILTNAAKKSMSRC